MEIHFDRSAMEAEVAGVVRRLVCAGEVVIDLVLTVPALPGRGGDVIATTVSAHPGGATNVMLAARRQGVTVRYAGLLGTGPMADRAAAALRAGEIEVVLPPRPHLDTATIVTLVEPDGQRTFVTTLGAEADLTEADLAAVPVGPDDVVYVSGYGLAYPRNGPCLARWVPTLPDTVTVVLDPGPLVATVPAAVLDPVLARVDWLTCDAREARVLDGPVARRGVIVRDGASPVTITTAEGSVVVDTFEVEVLDSNGAGDAHTGSLIASLVHHSDGSGELDITDVIDAVRRANAAAAISVTRPGPATAATTAEIDTFLADHRR